MRTRLAFDLSAKVAHMGLLSISLNTFLPSNHQANWTKIPHGTYIRYGNFKIIMWSMSHDKMTVMSIKGKNSFKHCLQNQSSKTPCRDM